MKNEPVNNLKNLCIEEVNCINFKERVEGVVVNKSQNEIANVPYDIRGLLPREIGTDYGFKRKIVWFNVFGFSLLHFLAAYGIYLGITSANIYTVLWMWFSAYLCGQGITMGAHRLYSHKTFKATFSIRFILILVQTMAGQNCLYVWVRDHRLHHKYSDTDADPHNSNRGFFFSHIGWLMSRKHPAVISKGKTLDMSDLEADWLVMFQKKYYIPLYIIFAIAIPVAIPMYLWNENYINSLFISYFVRNVYVLHITWLVNSAAHMFGTKPYDQNIVPVESWIVSVLSAGEGWHNYHHAFPWDYRASEFGTRYNVTTALIDLLSYFGLIYDLRSASETIVKHRTKKAGDGSHPKWGDSEQY